MEANIETRETAVQRCRSRQGASKIALTVYEYGKMDSGEEIKRMKGTISILMEWLAAKFKPKDDTDLDLINEGFRTVRKARQKPAHKIEDNVFDEAYYQQQRELIIAAYGSVRFLRQIFTNHPACKDVEVPRWLFEGHIWTQ